MWVAIELATLTTVLMVGIYRTPRGARGGLEILHPRQRRHRAGAVRHDPRLHGGAPGDRRGPRRHGLDGADRAGRATSIRSCSTSPSSSCMLGYGTKVGLAPLHAWLPDAHAEGPTPISAVLSGLLLNVALYAVLRFKMLLAANPAAIAPGPLMVDARARLAPLRRLHAVSAARHQTHVRLLLDRAHGASSPSPSAWAGRSPTSPASCT